MNFGTYGFPQKKFAGGLKPIADGVIRAIAVGSITQGDVVIASDSGIKALSYANADNYTSTIPQHLRAGNVSIAATVAPVANLAQEWAEAVTLTGGNVVVVYRNTTTQGIYFNLYAPDLSVIVSATAVATSNNSAYGSRFLRRCVALPNGNFAIPVVSGTSIKVSVYSPTGTLVTSNNVATQNTSSHVDFAMLLNSSGDLLVSTIYWTTGTPITLYRVNSSGVQQGATITVASPSYSGGSGYVRTCLQNSGDFVVAWCDAPNTGNINFARYSAAGALLQASTLVSASAKEGYNLMALADGGFIVAFYASSKWQYKQYNAAGALVRTVDTALSNSINVYLLQLSNTNIAICFSDTNNGLRIYDTSGNLVNTYYYPGSAGTTPVAVELLNSRIAFIGGAGYVCVLDLSGNFLYWVQHYGAVATVQAAVTTLKNGDIFCEWTTATPSLVTAIAAGQRQVILGVAKDGAEAGNTFEIQFGGEFGRPVSVPLKDDWGSALLSFDGVSAGGCKGELIGKTAYLKGM